ncbi:FG-GAP-like repeat-containing protein [Oleiharenicola lentus]|uniref:FG-GAP-like repeat-containing protein n=1 Tax=Oleiharenicola lentus TaxID=2508720 RepID=UPI003F67B18A
MFSPFRRKKISAAVTALLLLAGAVTSPAQTTLGELKPGSRVIVDKAGTGRRAIVLRIEDRRYFVVYEGEDESFDEWVEATQLRVVRPRVQAPFVAAPKLNEAPKPELARSAQSEAEIAVEALALSKTLALPRPLARATTFTAWLEPLARTNPSEVLRFNEAKLAQPYFKQTATGGIPSARIPAKVVLLPAQVAAAAGFAAMEGNDIAIYRSDPAGTYARVTQLDLGIFGTHVPGMLYAADLNGDNNTDLIVVGGPVVQIYFGTADGRFVPSSQPYRSKFPLGNVATGKFFSGANPIGLAVVEGDNAFRLLSVSNAGLSPLNEPFTVKFDRIVQLVPGDFDGDSFTDLAIATETRGRATGAWIFFNQNTTTQAFLWPVGGKDDFARALYVNDLDRDGRDDLIMTDNDADRGERVRIVYGSSGRSGLDDSWELLGSELGVGFGTASIVVADFNRDGRLDIGVGGRNGLRIHLGADYRRISRNPTWPVTKDGSNFPEHRTFVAGDFNGDGAMDLLGYTPSFATGYNLALNATDANVADIFVPQPLKRRVASQASSVITRVEAKVDTPPGEPVLQFLASRAEPYGPYRYRLVVEFAAMDDGVVQAVEATCKYDGGQITVTGVRQSEQQWSVEAVLPRGRNFEFSITARDDSGKVSQPLRVTVNP